jgi:hypothetical protein
MGFDIILAYNNIDTEMIFNFFNLIYSDMIIYKDLYLQLRVDKINYFINQDITIYEKKIESNVETVNDKPLESNDTSHISKPQESFTLKRVDYKDTIKSEQAESPFYNSPSFYVSVILTISLIGIGFYYYNNPIWLDYINLSDIDIDNLISDSLPGSTEEYSNYFCFLYI